MRRWIPVWILLWMTVWAATCLWGQASNPFSALARMNQGPDPTGNAGYPMSVVPATGSLAFPATLSPNFYLQDTLPNPGSTVPHVGSFGMIWDPGTAKWNRATSTVTANQGTNPWVTDPSLVHVNGQDRISAPNPNTTSVPFLASLAYGWDSDHGGPNGEWAPIKTTLAPGGQGHILLDTPQLTNGAGAYFPFVCPQAIDLGNVFSHLSLLAVGNYVVTGGVIGSPTETFTQVRTPKIFNTIATAAAGNTIIWTPTAGLKFRLMRWRYTVTDNATLAAPGVLTVTLNDAGGAIGQADDVFVPAIALLNNGQLAVSPWIDLGNGILSAAANNVLNINLSAALVTGTVRVQVCGTEEG